MWNIEATCEDRESIVDNIERSLYKWGSQLSN